MKKLAALAAVCGVLLLGGCAAPAPEPTPFDTAWKACIELNTEVYPDGLTDVDGVTWTPEELCHSTIGEQGKKEFTAFYNDPARVAQYREGLTGE